MTAQAQYGFFDRPQTSEAVCPRNTNRAIIAA